MVSGRTLAIKIVLAALVAVCVAFLPWAGQQKGAQRSSRAARPPGVISVPALDAPDDVSHRPQTVPASPVATIVVRKADGTPLKGARVRVSPIGRDQPAPAEILTNSEGRATLATEHGHYFVRADANGYAEGATYSELPGLAEVTLLPGVHIFLHPIPFPNAPWDDWKFRMRDEFGCARELPIDGAVVDAGCWRGGLVHGTLLHAQGQVASRSIAWALPSGGGSVDIDLPLPEPRRILVQVAPSLPQDLRVLLAGAGSTSTRPTSFDRGPAADQIEVKVSIVPCTLRFEAPGRATAWLNLANEKAPAGPHKIHLGFGAAVLCSFDEPPTKVDLHYVGPLEGSAVTFGLCALAGTVLPADVPIDVGTGPECYPQQALLTERITDSAECRFESVPANAHVVVRGFFPSGVATLPLATGPEGSETRVSIARPETRSISIALSGPVGASLEGCTVQVYRKPRGVPDHRGAVLLGPTGIVRLVGLHVADTYWFDVHGPRGDWTVPLPDLGSLADDTEVRLQLPAPATRLVSARVSDEDGQPMAGILVSFSVVDGPTQVAITDEQGRAAAEIARDSRVMVVARRPHEAPVTVPMDASGETRVTFRRRSTIEIELVSAAATTVNLEIRKGGQLRSRRTVRIVGASGIVQLRDLESGLYDVTAGTDRGRQSASVLVPSNGTGKIAIAVP